MTTCAYKGCFKEPVQGSRYCEDHLAERTNKAMILLGALGAGIGVIWGIFGYFLRKISKDR